jgi:hypothetical protein
MKDLIDEMRTANIKAILAGNDDTVATCAAVAHDHYKNKWISVKDMIPGTVKDADDCDWRYSKTVKFKTVGELECIGWIRFDFMEWIVKDRGIQYPVSQVTHWQPLPEAPQN